jgi:DedD protein
MELRAKQRLTGAIILVALFVLLVPELLTGPRASRPAQETTSDDGLHHYTIDLDTQNATNPPAAPGAKPPAVALPAVPAASSSTRAAPGQAAVPEAAAPSPPSAATNPGPAAHAASNPVAAPAPTTTTSVAPAQDRNTSTARPESAHPASSDDAQRATPATGSFAVQLGTFGKRENADRLVRDMTAKGFTAFVVPTNTNGHELFRVRVGPARDRAAAEALAAQLKRVGQSGSIVPIS